MASHKARRGGYYTQGRSGAYVVCAPNGQAFAATARTSTPQGPAWPVYVLGTKVCAATYTKADLAISKVAHAAVAKALVGNLPSMVGRYAATRKPKGTRA